MWRKIKDALSWLNVMGCFTFAYFFHFLVLFFPHRLSLQTAGSSYVLMVLLGFHCQMQMCHFRVLLCRFTLFLKQRIQPIFLVSQSR